MSAPTLFIIAADLTKMQVNANIDEADVGRMRPGQAVTFRVDAYPDRHVRRHGRAGPAAADVGAERRHLRPSSTCRTRELKLKPGMTANVKIEIARKTNVLRVPTAAARFRPTTDMFAALNQAVPPEARGGFGGRNARRTRRRRAGRPAAAPGGAPGGGAGGAAARRRPRRTGRQRHRQPRRACRGETQRQGGGERGRPRPERRGGGRMRAARRQRRRSWRTPRRQLAPDRVAGRSGGWRGGRGGFDPNMTPEERRKRMEERMAAMTPEERAAFQERMAATRRTVRAAAVGAGSAADSAGAAWRRTATAQPGNAASGGGPDRHRRRAAATGRQRPRAAPPGPRGERAAMTSGATTIDSLFAPLPTVETRGRAWLYINKQLKPVTLRLGISDGTNTEVLDGDELQPGTEVVTSVDPADRRPRHPQARPAAPAESADAAARRPGPGGNRGGGGGRGF